MIEMSYLKFTITVITAVMVGVCIGIAGLSAVIASMCDNEEEDNAND